MNIDLLNAFIPLKGGLRNGIKVVEKNKKGPKYNIIKITFLLLLCFAELHRASSRAN